VVDAVYWSEANAASETAECELIIATQKRHKQRAALHDAPHCPPAEDVRRRRRARHADRLASIRLRMAIGRELDERGITTPAEIGVALGMPAAEATGLLTRRQWREGDVALLQAAAARLGVQVPGP